MEQIEKKQDSFIKVLYCPVCRESEKQTSLFKINYYSEKVLKLNSISNVPEINIIRCGSCNHFYASHIIKPEILNRYYSEINSELYVNKCPEPKDGLIKKHIHLIKEIEKRYVNGGNILDIGCGTGFLLSYFDKERWNCFGIEPSPYASNIAKSKGVNIVSKFIEITAEVIEKFDVIVMLDLVEHVPDINDLINKAYKMLKKDGLLIIGTGNIGSFNAKIGKSKWNYFGSFEHISFFTTQSIKYLITRHKFKNLKIQKGSYHPSIILNIYILTKNLIKLFLFHTLKLRKNYSIHLSFDHMILFAQK